MNALTTSRGPTSYTCRRADPILAVVEKCLDNGIGACFVLGEDEHLLGRITLEDIRQAIVGGTAFDGGGLERLMSGAVAALPHHAGRLRNDPSPGEDIVTPIVDGSGHLVDVVVDRSRGFVPVAKPDLSHREFRAVLDAFISSWISSKGAYIAKFEQEFAGFVGMKHGIAVSNGTCALHLALLALGIGPGDEVIVPDLTFAATINAVLHCGATPVIVDIDPETWGMSVDGVARALTPRTRAIIPVHLYGRPVEIGPIADLVRQHDCFVIEDCAEAHGARYANRMVGAYGDISCFSFYANKIITTGEGGMCLANSDATAARLRELRDHGMAPDRFYWHERVGYNYRMTNLQAAIGVTQLRRIHEFMSRNARLEELYRERFRHLPEVRFAPRLAGAFEPVVWLVCAEVPAGARTTLMEAARVAGVELRPFFHSLSAMPLYANYARACPNSAALSQRGLNLPTSSTVDSRVLDKVAGVFASVLG